MEAGIRKKLTIRTGGQSGVDRAAMDFAREYGLPLCEGGPRASECPEAYDMTKAILTQVFGIIMQSTQSVSHPGLLQSDSMFQ